MNARELIHALSADWIEQDAEVELWAYDLDGQYVQHTITGVTARAHRTTLDTEPIDT